MNSKIFKITALLSFAVLISYLSANQYLIADSISPAEADIAAGKEIYTQCIGCHAPDFHRTGPKHCGILGRSAGTQKGFKYTTAMVDSNIVWTKESLEKFLLAPLKMIPGTSMGYVGIASIQERKQLVSFLSSLNKNNSLCK